MRSRLSIFSSRLIRSGLLATLIAVVAAEWQFGRVLPGHYFRHEVDEILYQLDHRRYDDRILSLGNSVGRQMDIAIKRLDRKMLRPMSSNAAIEMTGQYFLLRRYLERNPAPEALILWVDDPFQGNLRLVYTQNYIQRCFLRWREIGQIAWWKGSPTFTAEMIAYRWLPSFRFRSDIQKDVPFLGVSEIGLAPQVAFGNQSGAVSSRSAFSRWWQRRVLGDRSISSVAFERLVELCQTRGIELYLIPAPIAESVAESRGPMQGRAEINERLAALQRRFSVLHFMPESRVYPDDEFRDGTHFKDSYLSARARDYHTLLKEWMADDSDGI